MDSSKNGKWIIPFKKFTRVKAKIQWCYTFKMKLEEILGKFIGLDVHDKE